MLLSLGAPGSGQQFDASRAVMVHWPNPNREVIALLREAGVDVVVSSFEAARVNGPSLPILAEIPAGGSLEDLSVGIAGARSAGYRGAVLTAAHDRADFERLVKAQDGFVRLVYVKPEQLGWNVAPAQAVLAAGIWPGVEASDPSMAGATEKPWVNANLHAYAFLKGLYPTRTPLLAFHEAEAPKRFEAVEIALAEAFAAGGNAVLRVPEAFRSALLRGEGRAVDAWKSFAAVASFVKRNAGRRNRPDGSSVAMLAADWEESEELLKMAFRSNVAPRALPSDAIPPDPRSGIRLIAAPNAALTQELARKLVSFAKSGGIVMASPAADDSPISWPGSLGREARKEPNRDIHKSGPGEVYAYRGPVYDPAEFALDVRDAAGQDRRTGAGLHWLDFRVWNSGSVLGLLSASAQGEKVLALTHYGNERELEILVGVRGSFLGGTVEYPHGGGPKPLNLQHRRGFVEFQLHRWKRFALIVLKEAP